MTKVTMTEFQRKVYRLVRKIPKGRVLTYRQVAGKIGAPKAVRAVGNALNKNRDPGVPCHRVIRSDGKIGGYAYGAKKKAEILKKEGIKINNFLGAKTRWKFKTSFDPHH